MEFLEQVTFVDVGAYDGASLRRYLRAGGSVRDAHLFEPNPRVDIANDFDFPVTIHREAAWIANGHRPFYLSRLYEMEGSTLFPEKTTGDIDLANPIEVRCIDFPVWISGLNGQPIVLKLNAEGAEYSLVSGLAETGNLNKLAVVYLSLHAARIGLPPSADVVLHTLLETAGFERIQSRVYNPHYFEAWLARSKPST